MSELDNEQYKIFKSVCYVQPQQDTMLEDKNMATLLNRYYEQGYVVDKMTTTTTLVNGKLAMETTVLLRLEDEDEDEYEEDSMYNADDDEDEEEEEEYDK